MNENNITPRKLYSRTSQNLCYLCHDNSAAIWYRIFTISGKSKRLNFKINAITGIALLETEEFHEKICKKCHDFVEKAYEFRVQCQQKCGAGSSHSLKRVISPPKVDPKKCNQIVNSPQSKKQLQFTAVNPQKVRVLGDITNTSVQNRETIQPDKLASVYHKLFDVFISEPLHNDECHYLHSAINTSLPSAIASNITKTDNVFFAVKGLILKDVDASCHGLCKKDNLSQLKNTDFDHMAQLNFDDIFNEIKNNSPFIIDMFNSVTGKCCSIEDTPHNLKVKYSFIYSILMNERWHALSLVQRVNTVLITEGGCSKKVSFYYLKSKKKLLRSISILKKATTNLCIVTDNCFLRNGNFTLKI